MIQNPTRLNFKNKMGSSIFYFEERYLKLNIRRDQIEGKRKLHNKLRSAKV